MKVVNQIIENTYSLYHGDCVDVAKGLPDNSIHYSIFSPPFASLYTYSNNERDLGNCKTNEEFFEHFGFLVKELFRATMAGRLVSIHCMNLPTSKCRDGYIGITDFRGDIIRLFQKHGFIYASEVCIWKDPVVAMQRTKALGLLHKQLVKDSCMSRQGIADYLVTMRKPGINPEPVAGELTYFCGDKSTFKQTKKLSIDVWQRYASPIDVIERGLQLWSNPNDIILSPFMGIGSEGFVSVKTGRRFIGIELKESYYNQAVKNLQRASLEVGKESLFSGTVKAEK